jgi:mRNA interferase RelE/StbE
LAFTVEIKRRALRKLEKLDQKRKKSIREAIFALKEDPVPFRLLDVVKLKGYDNIYRVRLGGLRIVYAVMWEERRILIHYVGPRESAYD